MKKKAITMILAAIIGIHAADAQNKKTPSKAKSTKKTIVKKPSNPFANKGFKITEGGVIYKIFPGKLRGKKVNENDMISMHVNHYLGDTLLISTRKLNHNLAVEQQMVKPSFKGDMNEGLMMMYEGDSAVFLVSLDTLEARIGQKRPPFVAQKGGFAKWEIQLDQVQTQAEYLAKKEQKANEQKINEDNQLQQYFTENNLQPVKTASGLYILHKLPGSGGSPAMGDNVTMNYTGMLMDGKKFDSNVDPAFNHVTPFVFPIGKGRVIKGWDEGVAMLQKGGTATLYIPSHLGYGAQGAGADIPPNSILIFDVEMVDFETPNTVAPNSGR